MKAAVAGHLSDLVFRASGRSRRGGLAVGLRGGGLVRWVWACILVLLGTATLAQADDSAWKSVWRGEEAPSHVSLTGRVRTMISTDAAPRQGTAEVAVAFGKTRFDYTIGGRHWSMLDDGQHLIRLLPETRQARISRVPGVGLRPCAGAAQLRGATRGYRYPLRTSGRGHRNLAQGARNPGVAVVAGSADVLRAQARASGCGRKGGELDRVRVGEVRSAACSAVVRGAARLSRGWARSRGGDN